MLRTLMVKKLKVIKQKDDALHYKRKGALMTRSHPQTVPSNVNAA